MPSLDRQIVVVGGGVVGVCSAYFLAKHQNAANGPAQNFHALPDLRQLSSGVRSIKTGGVRRNQSEWTACLPHSLSAQRWGSSAAWDDQGGKASVTNEATPAQVGRAGEPRTRSG